VAGNQSVGQAIIKAVIMHDQWQDKEKRNTKKAFKNFTYGKQSKRPLRFYGGAIFLSGHFLPKPKRTANTF
jgi:hypothetical protein